MHENSKCSDIGKDIFSKLKTLVTVLLKRILFICFSFIYKTSINLGLVEMLVLIFNDYFNNFNMLFENKRI